MHEEIQVESLGRGMCRMAAVGNAEGNRDPTCGQDTSNFIPTKMNLLFLNNKTQGLLLILLLSLLSGKAHRQGSGHSIIDEM